VLPRRPATAVVGRTRPLLSGRNIPVAAGANTWKRRPDCHTTINQANPICSNRNSITIITRHLRRHEYDLFPEQRWHRHQHRYQHQPTPDRIECQASVGPRHTPSPLQPLKPLRQSMRVTATRTVMGIPMAMDAGPVVKWAETARRHLQFPQ